MNNYQYEDRDPQVGDLILWTDINKPENTNRTIGKPYLVTELLDNELIMIINDIGDEMSFGTVCLKVLKTKPASEAKVDDIMYRVRGGALGGFTPGTTAAITKIDSSNEIFSYSSIRSAYWKDVIVLDTEPQGVTMQTFTKADLKTGMMVETENRDYGLILGNAILWCTRKMGGTPLESIENYLYSNKYPIIKVYAERKDASGSNLIHKAENPYNLLGKLIYEVPVQKNQVQVHNAGNSSRTICINRETPELIHIGCFTGTFQEAVDAILNSYEGEGAAQYISKVYECFKLAEKEFKETSND